MVNGNDIINVTINVTNLNTIINIVLNVELQYRGFIANSTIFCGGICIIEVLFVSLEIIFIANNKHKKI